MKSLIQDALVFGLGTLAAGAALQGLYKATGKYPPEPVFWFFTGVGGFVAIEAAEHLIGKEFLTCDEGHRLT